MLPIAHIEKGALLRLAAVKKSAVVLVKDWEEVKKDVRNR